MAVTNKEKVDDGEKKGTIERVGADWERWREGLENRRVKMSKYEGTAVGYEGEIEEEEEERVQVGVVRKEASGIGRVDEEEERGRKATGARKGGERNEVLVGLGIGLFGGRGMSGRTCRRIRRPNGWSPGTMRQSTGGDVSLDVGTCTSC